MNTREEGNPGTAPLPEWLQKLVDNKAYPPDVAEVANTIPAELQPPFLKLWGPERKQLPYRIKERVMQEGHRVIGSASAGVRSTFDASAPQERIKSGPDPSRDAWMADLVREHVPFGEVLVGVWTPLRRRFKPKKILEFAILAAAGIWGINKAWQFVVDHHRQAPTTSNTSAAPAPASAPFEISKESMYVDQNKLELHWSNLGPGYTYIVYAKCDPEDSDEDLHPVVDGPGVATPGARVDMRYHDGCMAPQLRVQAMEPSGAAGPMTTMPMTFQLAPVNDHYSVEPLALQPTVAATPAPLTAGTPMPSSPAAAGVPFPSDHRKGQSPVGDGGPIKHSKKRNGSPTTTSGMTHGNASTNQSVSQTQSATPQAAAKKPSFFSSFAHSLIKNSDSAITSVIPIAPAAQAAIATKDAAMTANDDTNATSNEQRATSPNSALVAHGPLPVAPVIPIPTGLKSYYGTDTVLNLKWNSVGPGYTYDVFASPVSPINFTYDDPENSAPITTTKVGWNIPKDGTKKVLFEVRAVDAQGRQSASSERIEVDLP